jgi:RNA polymerase sigma-70 factor (ECF subfamily)
MKPLDNVIPLDAGRAQRQDGKPLAKLGDDELMLLARGGLGDAFDVLVRRHQDSLLRVAAKLLGEVASAKDAAQGTFLEVFRYLPKYQASGRFRSFMFQVLLNQCRAARRSAQRERLLQARFSSTPKTMQELPEAQLLAREQRREVERLLGRLSGKLRIILVLRFAGELSLEEISEILSVPLGTVKSRLFAGLERLKELLRGRRP